MPTRWQLKRCFCNVCVEKGGMDSDGNLKGVLMEANLIPTHLRCCDQEKQIVSHPSHSPTESLSVDPTHSPAIESISGQLFALTLADEGPGTEFSTKFHTSGVASPAWNTLPIAELANSLGRLNIQRSTSPATHSPLPPLSPLLGPALAVPAAVIGGCRVCKKDRHRCTIRAHKILANIEARIHRTNCCLLELSILNFNKMQEELFALQQGLEKIMWNVDSIVSKKKMLDTLLSDLELRLELHLPAGPVRVDTGM
ncbi:hypothetical protein JVU11DRAFT_11831 [Chiua virens]|nr:hypothetical protein JVU11DRAFT_11831 [Chiua virens]